MKSKEALELVNAGIKTLSEELAKGKSENLKRFLAVSSNFHNYSLNNWLMIYTQRPDATRVAGYKTWQKLGRQVKGGSKGIKILAPRTGKRKDDEGNETDKAFTYFTTTSVFDISDTEGEELPSVFRVEGDPGNNLFALEALIGSLGIELKEKENLGGALGLSYGGLIEILDDLKPNLKFTTLVHELAHELLHRQGDSEGITKAQRETEAEAVSFVVGQAIGVNSLGQTADYVQLWKGDLSLLVACLSRVQKCAKQIIEGLQSSPVEV